MKKRRILEVAAVLFSIYVLFGTYDLAARLEKLFSVFTPAIKYSLLALIWTALLAFIVYVPVPIMVNWAKSFSDFRKKGLQ